MASFADLAAPVALILPMLGGSAPEPDVPSMAAGSVMTVTGSMATSSTAEFPTPVARERRREVSEETPPEKASSNTLEAFYTGINWRQTRIDSRVIIRISPQRTNDRRNLLARLPQRSLNTRYKEQKADKCLSVEQIAGVQTGSGNRLLLFLRDSKIMSLNLEKACRARDFYSGFYVERSKDGKLCVDRDKLHSRNGARCEIDRMMQLVATND